MELGVFEGPLDLLLHLIDKNELNIYDVPLHLLAEQYISYLESLEMLDLEVASDFLIVASQLMYAKSKALLPRNPEDVFDNAEEDLEELLRLQLLEYRSFKKASEYLNLLLGKKKSIGRCPAQLSIRSNELEAQSPLSLLEAWKNFYKEEISLFPSEEVVGIEPFNIEEKMLELEEKIRLHGGTVGYSLQRFLGASPSKTAWLVSILAVLELVRLKKISIDQKNPFSDIYLHTKWKGDEGKNES